MYNYIKNNENVYVILVIYNNKLYLKACIDSLLAQTYRNIHILAVDNKSPDDSVQFIRENYPEIVCIQAGYNSGFAAACNMGMKYAFEKDADYCLLINVDTVADEYLVEKLVNDSKGINVVAPFIYSTRDRQYAEYDGCKENIWYAGGEIDYINLFPRQQEHIDASGCEEVSFISGCCMLIPFSVFDKVGFFSEEYYMYYEDTDYCIRLLKNGIRQLYEPEALLWHAEGGSREKNSGELYNYYTTRNRLLIMRKYENLFPHRDRFFEDLIIVNNYGKEFQNNSISYPNKGIKDYLMNKSGRIESFDFKYGEGFRNIEYDGDLFCWAISPYAEINLINYSPKVEWKRVIFSLFYDDNQIINCTFYYNGNVLGAKYKNDHYELMVPLPASSISRLGILVHQSHDNQSYIDIIEEHLFFQVRNLKILNAVRYRIGEVLYLDTSHDKTADYYCSGLGEEEETGRWTIGSKAEIVIPIENEVEGDFVIDIGILNTIGCQRVTLNNLGFPMNSCTVSEEDTIKLFLSGDRIRDCALYLEMSIPDAISPRQFDGSDDLRKLGVFLSYISINKISA